MYKYLKTADLAAREKTNGGILYMIPDVLIRVTTLVPLIFLWKVVMSSGVDVGMSIDQMLTYTFVHAILADMLVVKTAATGWLSDGILQKLFGRPMSVLGQLTAETVGRWIPMLLLFSLPTLILAPILGVSLIPRSVWIIPSLILSISLGIALECLFACLSIRLRSMNWLIDRIRAATVMLFSGTLIPIRLLPFGLAAAMRFQPFAALGGSPLQIFIGTADTAEILLLQVFWNAALWPLALLAFSKSRERMVSYGG